MTSKNDTKEKDAWEDLVSKLEPGEAIEANVFGNWGWCSSEEPVADVYREPSSPPVPLTKRGVLLSPEEARPLMRGWSFYGGFGSPECYAMRAWSNRRVFWVTQYDGATSIDCALRNPTAHMPDMPGG